MLHFHKYKLISSQIGIGTATYRLTGQVKEDVPMTTILYQCMKCGKFKSKSIEGKWEITKLNK
jgi:hypothetical protein